MCAEIAKETEEELAINIKSVPNATDREGQPQEKNTEKEKLPGIQEKGKEMAEQASYIFNITDLHLENQIGKYKERGPDCLDLKEI